MAKNIFNNPLQLINKKPNGTQMIANGYGFYMYPSLVVEYANKVLTDRERRLYFAISGQAGKDIAGKPYKWTLKHYCQIANIKSNHYSEVLQSLCKKGFIIHKNFESIEVLFPISESECISASGKIKSRQDSLNGKNKSCNEQKLFPPKKEENEIENRKIDYNFGNEYSQGYANNKEINNLKKNIKKEEEKKSSQDWEDFGAKKIDFSKIKLQDLI